MKKIISAILVCVLLVGCMFTLASCGKKVAKGTYKDALNVTSYTFKGNKVTLTIDNIVGEDTVLEGKYEINKNDDGELEITFEFEGDDDDAEKNSTTVSYSEGEEDGKKYIKLGGFKYTKAD